MAVIYLYPYLGLRGTGTVFVAEEERRALLQLAEGNLRRQQEATGRLQQMSQGVVRILHVALIVYAEDGTAELQGKLSQGGDFVLDPPV